ncbi:MAG: CPBP family intramembrane metalloprotease [Candidatus Omnitrophica bacterium]|nr:CPBP family intramembrane metalloprotease [Candidatus Omnitrophota bacterium]
MKRCPFCDRELADSAVRCRYCRRPLGVVHHKRSIASRIKRLASVNLEKTRPSWSISEVLLLWLLIFVANLAIQYSNITSILIDLLRGRYFILIKEPALQFHLHIFTATFLLKLTAVFFIWLILKIHGTGFMSGLNLTGLPEKRRLWILPAFFAFAAVGRLVADIDPLSPNLPVYFFFSESSFVGTIFTMFSLAIVAPVSEEIFFRGFVYPGINKKFGFYASVLITAFLFMAVHVPQCAEHPFALVLILIGGILLTLIRALTGSTLMAVIAHALYNISVVAVGFIKFLIFKY